MATDNTMQGSRGLATRAFHLTGASSLSRRLLATRGRFVLVFHGVATTTLTEVARDAQPDLTVDDLRAILRWVSRRFALLRPRELLETSKAGVLLTFDDGFANAAHNALPVLEEFNAPAVFFVPTQHVAAPKHWLRFVGHQAAGYWPDPELVPEGFAEDVYDGMSVDQLRQCADHPLITIGSHTVTHPFLTRSSDEEIHTELVESRRFLEQTTGTPVGLFAYPAGDYDMRVAHAVAESGYDAAFVLDTKHIGFPRFEIPRIGIYGSHRAYLDSKLSGLHRPPLPAEPIGR